MPKIPMRSGFKPLEEGTMVLRIYEVKFEEEYGRLFVKMVNAKGKTHSERYGLKKINNLTGEEEWNEGALTAFSIMAKAAIGDPDAEDIDPDDLVNCYFKAEVYHDKSQDKNDPSRVYTNVRFKNYEHVDEFDEEPVARALTIGAPPKPTADNLDSLLEDDDE